MIPHATTAHAIRRDGKSWLGKRQNKTFVKFRGSGHAKTNDGGLSEVRETLKQTTGRKNEDSLAYDRESQAEGLGLFIPKRSLDDDHSALRMQSAVLCVATA